MDVLINVLTALQLLEILSPWRHTADEALATQIEVFEDSHSEDDSQLNMPGGIDINSHEDMFNAVLAKVHISSVFGMSRDNFLIIPHKGFQHTS